MSIYSSAEKTIMDRYTKIYLNFIALKNLEFQYFSKNWEFVNDIPNDNEPAFSYISLNELDI